MYKSESIRKELDKDIYEFDINLNEIMSFRFRRKSSQHKPANELVMVNKGKEWYVPLLRGSFPNLFKGDLGNLNRALERVDNGELEVIIGTKEEVSDHQVNFKKREGICLYVEYQEGEVPDDSKKLNLKKELVKTQRGSLQMLIKQRRDHIERLVSLYNPKFIEFVQNNISYARKDDERLIEEFNKSNYKIEELHNAFSIQKTLCVVGNIVNVISLGKFKNKMRREIDTYLERSVGWEALRLSADSVSKNLNPDILYLSQEERELAEQLRLVQNFYGDLAIDAGVEKNKMKRLLERAEKLYGDFIDVENSDPDILSEGLLEKMCNFTLKLDKPKID